MMDQSSKNSSFGMSGNEFELLVQRYLDGALDDQSAARFRDYLYRPEYLKAFVDRCRQEQLLYELIASNVDVSRDECSPPRLDLLTEFGRYEKVAPVIEPQPLPASKTLIQKVEYPKVVRKVSRWSIVSTVLAAAAVLFIILFVRFAPVQKGIQVATLVDQIDAAWSGEETINVGSRFVTGGTNLLLRDGFAKLLFDNQAQIMIEGPAEFQISAEDQVKLNYGKLYATIPQGAIGFVINTPSARVIDLGTEFGVDADSRGDTFLHVIKGKTTLIAGERSNKVSLEVVKGIAKKISFGTQTVSDISCDEHLFARDIDSANDLVWRGEDLARDGYMSWAAASGNWSDAANWDTGKKPDGARNVLLRKGKDSICVLNTVETPISTVFTASNGQTLNIENGGYMGCGWTRFGDSAVNMTGNGTWLLNDDDLYIGYPVKGACQCVWTMSDTSTIDINKDSDNRECLYISQDNARGILRIIGSGVTINCDQLYVGYPRNPGFEPQAVLEYVMDSGGVSTIHVGYRLHLSEEPASSHLVLKAAAPLPTKDLVLIETLGREPIIGGGSFDTLNGGPAAEGTAVSLGSNQYVLTYQYDANSDGCRNDVALVLLTDPQEQ